MESKPGRMDPPERGMTVSKPQAFRVRESDPSGREVVDAGFPPMQQPLSVEERLLRKVSSDQLFSVLKETRDGPKALGLRQAKDQSDQSREARKSAVFTKLGKGKDMHRINVRLQKSFKDMVRAIRDLRIAGQMRSTGPGYLLGAMNRMLVATEGYMSLLRPLVPLMKDTNSINQDLASSARSERTILQRAGQQKTEGIEALPDDLTNAGMARAQQDSTGEVREGMQVGKFYFAWTKESLGEGLSLIGEAVGSMREALKAGKEYMPPEQAQETEDRIGKVDRRSKKMKKKLGQNKGEGLRMNAEEGAMRRVDDEKGRMQEGLWAALATDSFSASI